MINASEHMLKFWFNILNRTLHSIQSFSNPYSVRMQENMDQKNSKYGHFGRFTSKKYLSKVHNFQSGACLI